LVNRYFKRYHGVLLHLWCEEYLGWITRSLPGPEGIFLRGLVFSLLLKEARSMPYIYPGVYLTHTYGIRMGRSVALNTGVILDGRGGITIGDNVLIGPYVAISSSTHQYAQVDLPMNALDHVMQPVVLENDIWVGAHAFIRGGIRIGTGVVIAAGAVVVRDVPEYKIVGGVPAQVMGDRREMAASQEKAS
jgi:acetyltransferase-like isoleucine patch superfamily enzyme